MSIACRFLAGVAAALVVFGLTAPAQAVQFNFVFDATRTGAIDSGAIGAGVLEFDDPGGDGTFDFASLANLSLDLTVGGHGFTQADVVTRAGTTVRIATAGGVRTLRFGGIGSGAFGGSLDLGTMARGLSFSPEYLVLGQYVLMTAGGFRYGDYRAVEAARTVAAVPIPPTLPLLGAALGLGLARRRQRG